MPLLASFPQALFHQLFEPGDNGLPAIRHLHEQAARSIAAGGTQGGSQLHKRMLCRMRRCQFQLILVPGALQHRAELAGRGGEMGRQIERGGKQKDPCGGCTHASTCACPPVWLQGKAGCLLRVGKAVQIGIGQGHYQQVCCRM